MEKTFTEKEVIDIISLVEAIKDGKKVETPNGKGGYVEVKDISVNDLLQHFKKYRIKIKDIKTVIKEVKEAINSSPCSDCIDTSDNDEIDCSKCPFNDELTNEELLSRIAENNSNKKNKYNINSIINKEESNMIQNENNVTQEPKFTVTNITYGDTLSENIKSVIRSDMTEDEKVSVIIGLFNQRTNYVEYPWNQPQTIYQTTAENKNESKTYVGTNYKNL